MKIGKSLIVLFYSQCILINISGQSVPGSLKPYIKTGHTAAVKEMRFNNDGNYLVSRDDKGTFILWDFFAHTELERYNNMDFQSLGANANGAPLKLYKFSGVAGSDFSSPVYFNKNSQYIVLKSNNAKIEYLNKKRRVVVITKIIKPFVAISLNADSSVLSHACGDKYVSLLKLTKPDSVIHLGFYSNVASVLFHPFIEGLLCVGLEDGSIRVVDINTTKEVWNFGNPLLKITEVVSQGSGNKFFIKSGSLYVDVDFDNLRSGYSYLNVNSHYATSITTANIKDKNNYLTKGFYLWNNFGLYSSVHDSLTRIRGYTPYKLNQEVFEHAKDLVRHPRNFFDNAGKIFSRSDSLSPNLVIDPALTRLMFAKGNHIIEYENNKFKKYFIRGEGNITFSSSSNLVVAFRPPYYITTIDKSLSKQNCFFAENVSRILVVEETPLFFIQHPNLLSLYSSENGHKLMKNYPGTELITIGQDSREVFIQSDFKVIILNTENLAERILFSNAVSKVKYVHVFRVGSVERAYLLIYDDGSADIIGKDGDKIGRCYFFNGGDYLILTNDNYFIVSSKSVIDQVALEDLSGHTYSLAQFELIYNRPDIVTLRLPLFDSVKNNLFKLAYINATKGTKNLTPQQTNMPPEITSSLSNQHEVDGSVLKCSFSFQSNTILKMVNVYVNNTPLFGIRGLNISGRHTSKFDTSLNINMSIGTNFVRPVSADTNGVFNLSRRYFVNAKYPALPGIVYFIGIGVEKYNNTTFNLSYPIKDIKGISAAFKEKAEGRFHPIWLFDKDFSLDTLRFLLNKLKTINLNDKFILAYSGHGILDSLNLILGSDDKKNGVPYREIELLVEALPSRSKLIFLDACNAVGDSSFATADGGQQAYFMMQDLFGDFSDPTGTTIIGASRINQKAQEGDAWGNGAFSYAIIMGLKKGYADINNDGEITVTELKNYVEKKVTELTYGKQRPTAKKDKLDYDWSLW